MKQVLYSIIYNPSVNFLIRNINRLFFKAIVKIPPSGKVKLRYDDLSFYMHTNQTNHITHVLFYEGCENFEYSPVFKKLIAKCGTFFDIGANTGYYTILGSRVNPSLKTTCFEPAKGSLHYLSQSMESNRISDRVKIEPVALAGMTGKIEFNDVTNHKYKNLQYNLAGESSTSQIQTGRPFDKYEVPCITLNDYMKTYSGGKIDLMKMDTEGTEDTILKHASSVLTNHKPIIICETLFNRIEASLDSIMREYGYEFYNQHPNGLVQVDTIKRDKNDGVNNCFFVHPDKRHLIEEFIVRSR